jgi:hypothetical protein
LAISQPANKFAFVWRGIEDWHFEQTAGIQAEKFKETAVTCDFVDKHFGGGVFCFPQWDELEHMT